TGDAGVRRARTPGEHVGLAALGTLHCHPPRLSSIPFTARSLLVEFGHLRNARNVRASGGCRAMASPVRAARGLIANAGSWNRRGAVCPIPLLLLPTVRC